MSHASIQKLFLALRGAIITLSLITIPAFAQQGPSQLNISGGLFSPDGKAVTGTVNFRLEVWDANNTCLLYTEDHAGQNLTATKGGFSLEIGKGSGISNRIDAISPTALSAKVFENPGAVPSFPGCAAGVTLSSGDVRLIRVYYDKGSGYTAMTPDVPIGASAYAMVAETLQGKRPADFVQIRDDAGTDLTQLNLENIFSATNYPRLTSLLSGNFGNQPITNVGAPTNPSDAATKGYTDANVGGRATDFTGIGAGVGNNRIVVWDAAGNRWTTAAPSSFTDATKLPLAGGTMSGAITMGGNDILGTGHITMTAGRTLTLGTYTAATEPTLITSLGIANEGASWYNSDENVYKIWNGTAAIPQAYLASGKISAGWIPNTTVGVGSYGSATQVPTFTVSADGRLTTAGNVTISGVAPGGNAGGDLTGTYPSPLIRSGAVVTAKIADEAITSAKINSTSSNFGINRLLITDGATGNSVTYSVCSENEVLRYTTATGWACTNAATLSAVISVNGKTGVVNLNANDLGLGTASMKNYGTAAGELVELDAGGKIPSALMPTGTGTVTNIATGTGLVGGPITSTGTISLSNTGVSAGTYGTGTAVPVFSVDAQGRIYSVSNVTITGAAPTGSATGDLSGSYPSPVVASLQGSDVSETAPTVAGQILRWNSVNMEWEASTDGSALTALNASSLLSGTVAVGRLPALTGDVTSTSGTGALYLGAGVVGPSELENTAVTVGTYGTSTSVAQFSVDAQGRITGATNVTITGAAPTGAASGDLSGSYPAPTVARLQGAVVSASAPSATGQVLRWNGSAWEASTDGSALTSLNASNLSSGTLAAGRLPAHTGDVTSNAGSAAMVIAPNAVDSGKIADGTVSSADLTATGVSASTYGTGTQVPQFSVDAAGRITGVTNVTITGAAPTGAASGDLSANFPSPIVARLQGSPVSSTAPSAAGQVLRWNGSQWEANTDGSALTALNATNISSGTLASGRLPALSGDVTAAAGSGTLTIPTNSIASGKLTNTGVSVGTYGTGTQVPQFSVDAAGRVTGVTNVTITGAAPTGAASGDLSANFPSPTVARLQGSPVSSTAPSTAGQVLRWNGSQWEANTDGSALTALNATNISSGTLAASRLPAHTGDVTSNAGSAALVIAPNAVDSGKISDGTVSSADLTATGVSAATYGTGTQVPQFSVDAAGRVTGVTNVTITGAAPTGAASGDLSANFPSPVVARLQGSPVSSTTPSTAGQVLRWNGSQWEANTDGSALTALNATNISTGTLAAGRLPAHTGDVTSAPGSAALTIATGAVGAPQLASTSVSAGTYGTSTAVAQFSVDADGRITGATNVTITGAAPTGAASGDLSANFPSPTVARLQGSPVSSTAPSTAGQVLRWNGSQWEANTDGSALTSLSASNISSGTLGSGRLPALSGDVTSAAGSGTLTIPANSIASGKLTNTGVSAATYGTGTQVPQFSVDAAGRVTGVTNVTITGAAPTGAASGDLSANFPSPVVARLQGSPVSSAAPSTAGQVLRWNGSQWEANTDGSALTALNATNISSGTLAAGRLPAHTGDVTSVAGSAGLTIAPNVVTSAKMSNTGVSAATYGTGTQVPQFSVDAAGRITGVTNVTITGAAPTGAASGDLSASFPSPVVARLQGSPVSSTAPATAGQVLRWNGSQWEANTDGSALTALNATNITSGTLAAGRLPGHTGDVTSAAGSAALTIVTGAVGPTQLASTSVTVGTYGTSTSVAQFSVDADGRITGATNVTITGAAPTGAASGDLSANFPSPTVARLQGSPVSSTAPSTAGQVLRWNGSQWEANTDGSALTALNATNISSGTLAAGRLPGHTGDVTSAAGSAGLTIAPNAVTSAKMSNTGVSAATYGTGTQVPQFSVDAAGRITGATNVTITGAAPTGAASGDLSANFPSPTVARLQGSPVSSTAPSTAGQVLRWNGSQWEANTDGSALTALNATNISSGTLSGARLPAFTGDVTSAAGTTALGIATGAVGPTQLASTSVSAGTYGSATQVPQFTVDGDGRITGVNLVTVSGVAPSFPLNGSAGTAAAPTYSFTSTDSDTGIFRPAADELGISTASTERLRVTATGRIGIGISAPTADLHLHTGSQAVSYLQFSNTSTGAGTYDGLWIGFDTLGANIWMEEDAPMRFATQGTERMRISNTGSLGIGTTAPARTFHVAGTDGMRLAPSATPATPAAGDLIVDSGAGNTLKYYNGSAWINAGGSGSTASQVLAVDGTQAAPSISFASDPDTGMFRGGTDTVAWSTSATERMRIDSVGRVGIGTTTPARVIQAIGSDAVGAIGEFIQNVDDDAERPALALTRQRSSATAPGAGFGPTLRFQAEGSSNNTAPLQAQIHSQWETAQTNNTTARDASLVFSTTADDVSKEWVRITSGGNVGIGTTSIARKLHVAGTDGMRLAPSVIPGSPAAGDIIVDSGASNTLKYYNGSAWIAAGGGGGSDNLGDHTATTTLNMANFPVVSVDTLSISDVGPSEGLNFISASVSDWSIDVAPLARTNADGNLNLYGISNNIALWRPALFVYDATNYSTVTPLSTGGLNFTTTGTGNIALNPGGNVGIGLTNPGFPLEIASDSSSELTLTTASLGSSINGRRAGGTLAAKTAVANGEFLLIMRGQGYDGSGFRTAGSIEIRTDGTPGANDMPGRIMFSTTPDGATATAEHMRIDSVGRVGIGTTSIARKLHVAGTDGMRLAPSVIPGSPVAGDIIVDSGANNTLKFYNGTAWVSAGGGGSVTFPLAGSAGTAAAPTYSFSGDTDNGMFLATTNEPAFSSAGTERIRIDNNGNVGIGVTDPLYKLHVLNTDTAIPRGIVQEQISNDDSSALFGGRHARGTPAALLAVQSQDYLATLGAQGYDGSAWQVVGFAGYQVTGAVASNSIPSAYVIHTGINSGSVTEKMRVTSGGVVGIGTTSPARKLHIAGTDGMRLAPSVIPGSPVAGDIIVDSGANNTLKFYNGTAWVSAGGGGSTSPGGLNQQIQFNNSGVFGGSANFLWTGTDLEVNGGIYQEQAGGAYLTLARGDATTVLGDELGVIQFGSTDVGAMYPMIRAIASEAHAPGAAGSHLTLNSIPNGTAASQERVRIDAGGNVGIGTTTPSRKLHIVGTDGMRLEPSAVPATPAVGDIIVDSGASNTLKFYNGTAWVSAGAPANYTAAQITNTAAGNIAATTVQAAVDELDSEKVAKAGDTMTGQLILPAGGLAVGTNQLTVSALGSIGIGSSAPTSPLYISKAFSNTAAGTIYNIRNEMGTSIGANSATTWIGDYTSMYTTNSGGFNLANVYANRPRVFHNNTGTMTYGIGTNTSAINQVGGTITSARGIQSTVENTAGGTIGSGMGAFNQVNNLGAGIITTATGTFNEVVNTTTGTMTTAYGTRTNIENTAGGAITTAYGSHTQLYNPTGTVGTYYGNYVADAGTNANYWAFYAAGTTKSYFGGNVGIGTTNPGMKFVVAQDNANYGLADGYGQVSIRGTTDDNKRLNLGYNTTGNYGWLQSGIHNTAYGTLALNPAGGNVGIGTTAPAVPLEVKGEIRATDASGNIRLWGQGRPGATRYGTTGVEAGLCTNGAVNFGLSYMAVEWGNAQAACPAATWVCTGAERGTAACDTARPDGAIDGVASSGSNLNWTASTHYGWVSDVGTFTQAGRAVQENGNVETGNFGSNNYPIWCCSQ